MPESGSSTPLTTTNHDRDATGMTYVYPVISRRAGGVSVGINLNPNNACNWHCIYCQVPGLKRGSAPTIDLQQLEHELVTMLEDILHGQFMAERVPESCRTLCDIAISGNGEPTSCSAFDQIIELIVRIRARFGLSIPLRLITNGSYLGKRHVQQGLAQMAEAHGELWIKVDSATESGIERINGVGIDPTRLLGQLERAITICPSWIQTCMFAVDGAPPSEQEIIAYLGLLRQLKARNLPLRGVLLYGLARPSMQEQAEHLSPLDADAMHQIAARIREAGFEVTVSV